MTKEEATALLKSRVDLIKSNYPEIDDYCEALEMAIEALKQEPCEDAISRQAVLDLMRSLTRWCVRSEDGKFNNVGLLYDDVMFGIDKLPSVIQKPKTGHWAQISPQGIYECSECGQNVMTSDICVYKFCHGCGAKMVEPQESEDKE